MTRITQFLAAAGLALATLCAAAGEYGTLDEAKALVKKAVAYADKNGPQKAFDEFSKSPGPFVDRDLYVVVYDMKGKVLAHGANEKMIGKNLIELKDVDGKAFVKERVELAQSKGTFWQDYKFTNPVSKKIEPKQMYCEKLDDTAVCGGIYK